MDIFFFGEIRWVKMYLQKEVYLGEYNLQFLFKWFLIELL